MPWEPFEFSGGGPIALTFPAEFWTFLVRTVMTILAILGEYHDPAVIYILLLVALAIINHLLGKGKWGTQQEPEPYGEFSMPSHAVDMEINMPQGDYVFVPRSDAPIDIEFY